MENSKHLPTKNHDSLKYPKIRHAKIDATTITSHCRKSSVAFLWCLRIFTQTRRMKTERRGEKILQFPHEDPDPTCALYIYIHIKQE